MYNSLVERCFMDCINDFTTRSLSSKEVRGPVPGAPRPGEAAALTRSGITLAYAPTLGTLREPLLRQVPQALCSCGPAVRGAERPAPAGRAECLSV